MAEQTWTYELGGGVLCRELLPGDGAPTKAFRESAAADVTGFGVWGSSVVLSRFFETEAGRKLLAGRHVAELGAGCGLAGLVAARCCSPASLLLTEANARSLENLQTNANLNRDAHRTAVTVAFCDWDEPESWPQTDACDVLIGADLLYRRSYSRKLLPLLASCVPQGGLFICATPAAREGLPLMRAALAQAGWSVEVEIEAPEEWRVNPLCHGLNSVNAAVQRDALFPELAMKSIAFQLLVLVWRRGSKPHAEL